MQFSMRCVGEKLWGDGLRNGIVKYRGMVRSRMEQQGVQQVKDRCVGSVEQCWQSWGATLTPSQTCSLLRFRMCCSK